MISKENEKIDISECNASLSSNGIAEAELITDKSHEDVSLKFIQKYRAEHPDADLLISQVNADKVTSKVDKRMMFLMFFTYFLQFLDKVTLNYSRIMGMTKDIGLVGNQFSDLATYFFVGFLIFEPVQGLFLHKFAPAKVLSVNVILWGIFTACCCAAQNYKGMLTLRILLGLSEAAISPCLVLITASWYTAREGAFRCGIWYCGLGCGQLFGGLISYLFQLISHNVSFAGWRIMFLVVGMLNLACGVCCYFFLPKNPVESNFLNDDEKYALLVKLSASKVGTHNQKIVFGQIFEALTDITWWLILFLTITISFSSNTITSFSSTDIIGFGFTSKEAALLNMPSGLVSILSTLFATYAIMKGFPRSISIALLCLPAVTGGALMSFLPKTNKAGLLVGIYMINTIVAPLAIIYSWTAANVSGHTKKVCFNISVMIGFAVGNIAGPQSYRVKDAPHYLPAKASMLATQAVSIVFVGVLFLVYYIRNKRRNASNEGNEEEDISNAFHNMTDFENRSFRYCY